MASERAAARPGRWRTYAVEVLGCKVNQYEARQIGQLLARYGLRPVTEGESPDLAIVHTCAVTAAALRKSGQAVRRAAAGAPGRAVIASGCGGGAGLFRDGLPVRAVVPPGPDWMENLCAVLDTLPLPGEGSPESAGALAADRYLLEGFSGHARAFLKIQDGCDLNCSYCIVPSLRRGSRDKALDDILREARALVRAGHREIVVTGISVGLFGRGGGSSLAEVLRMLSAVEGLERLRLSSLHPAELTPDLLDAWAASPVMAPHVHLPLQSGSTRMLRRMRRGYTARSFLEAIRRVRDALDRPAFTTDIIVGFPGETDEDFERTLAVCEQVGFSRLHLFPYSPRPGTAAADWPDRPAAETVKARIRRLRALGRELAAAYYRGFEGETVRVLAEQRTPDGQGWEGYAERYIPVRFEGPADQAGRIVPVRIAAATADGATGRAD